MIRNIMIALISVTIFGCSTVATQSEDGRELKIRGSGSAEFENGAKIEGGSFMPKLPTIEMRD